MSERKKYNKMPIEVSIHLRYLHQDQGIAGKELVKRYPQYAQRSVYHNMKLPIGERAEDKRKANPGRPRKLTQRDERQLVTQITKLRDTTGVFNSTHIQRQAGIAVNNVSNRTVRRCLGRLDYKYEQCRRKGQVTKKDMGLRLKFAKDCKKNLNEEFWKTGISFYLDGVSWAHKTNPAESARTMRTRTWKKRGEGLSFNCTAKGKKEGVGGKVARFIVSIGYGVGVVQVEHLPATLNGNLFANFIRDKFNDIFSKSANPQAKLFLQDGDPSQNSAVARKAMAAVGCELFKIPARSPDINPIENIFHLVNKELRNNALEQNITKETYPEFVERCKQTLLAFPLETINKTIASMDKRMDLVIKAKGQRIKY